VGWDHFFSSSPSSGVVFSSPKDVETFVGGTGGGGEGGGGGGGGGGEGGGGDGEDTKTLLSSLIST
jgi:hypothetical protein